MTHRTDLETALLTSDGAARDMNFEAPRWEGIAALLEPLEEQLVEANSLDGDGAPIATPIWASIEAATKDADMVHLSYRPNVGPIRQLQVFVFREGDGSPFIELTFFPEDVTPVEHLETAFRDWAQRVTDTLKARRCFCRHENASWRFGDVGPGSGVFLVI
ncbi:hypothetical protein [Aliiroseovarius sp.]|uniref:hypothetical protein n=1 Tax=Aliiroseovarius sp. TaxID=1872442 RepID=UPI003BAA77FB